MRKMACVALKAVYMAQPSTIANPATCRVRSSSLRRTWRNLARRGAAVTKGLSVARPGVQPRRRMLLFQLDDPDAVLTGIDEPGNQSKRTFGHAVNSLQAGQVVLLDLHTSRARLGELSREVLHPPGRLGLRIGRTDSALADGQTGAAAAFELDGICTLVKDLQTDLVEVEVLRGFEVGGEENHIDRILA